MLICSGSGRCRDLGQGEPDGETGAAVRAISHGQPGVLLAEDLGGEVESEAAPRLLGGEARLEDPFEMGFGDARPVVGDVDLDPVLRLVLSGPAQS